MKKINCRKCIHYFVTWKPLKPHGCKVYGFEAKQIPSMVVFSSSGLACQSYEEKPSRK